MSVSPSDEAPEPRSTQSAPSLSAAPDPAEVPADLRPAINRVKRAQGQLGGVLRMLEEGRDLEAVVQQLKAVTGALERAGFAVVATDLKRSLGIEHDLDEAQLARVEKLLLSLS